MKTDFYRKFYALPKVYRIESGLDSDFSQIWIRIWFSKMAYRKKGKRFHVLIWMFSLRNLMRHLKFGRPSRCSCLGIEPDTNYTESRVRIRIQLICVARSHPHP
jgi:hypothetical protein